MRSLAAWSAVLVLVACGSNNANRLGDSGTQDSGAGKDGSKPGDSGTDGAGGDSGTPDSGTPDSGTPDSATPDSATPDAATPDAATPDAATPDSTPDAAVTCLVANDLTTATAQQPSGVGVDNLSAPNFILLNESLNADALPDVFDLELYKGFTAFAGGFTTLDHYQLAGDDLQYSTCGVCAFVLADLDFSTGNSAAAYLATGGTLTITSLSPRVTGRIEGATMVHVDIDPNTFVSTPNPDGCATTLTLDFDEEAPVPALTKSGKKAPLRVKARVRK